MFPLKTNWKRGKRINQEGMADTLTMLCRVLNNIRGITKEPSGMDWGVDWTAGGSEGGLGSPEMIARAVVEMWDFGIKTIDGALVTINGGDIMFGLSTYTCGETNITLTLPDTYVGWQFVIPTHTLSIVNFGAAVLPGANTICKWLYQFHIERLDAPNPIVSRYGMMNPILPGNYGI